MKAQPSSVQLSELQCCLLRAVTLIWERLPRVSDRCPAPRLQQCITPRRPVVRDIPQSNTAFSLAHTLRTWEGKGPTERVRSHTAGLAPVRWFLFCRFHSWADGLCRCAYYDIISAFILNMRWSVFLAKNDFLFSWASLILGPPVQSPPGT